MRVGNSSQRSKYTSHIKLSTSLFTQGVGLPKTLCQSNNNGMMHTKSSRHFSLCNVILNPRNRPGFVKGTKFFSWRHSEKRADSNQARAYKAKRRGIKLTRETALAREKRIFHFPHLVSSASLLQNRHSYRNFALFILRGNEVTKTLVHTTS